MPAGDLLRPALAAQAERGEWARRRMIESNLRLVVAIVRRLSATGLPLGDLVQEGNLGLLRGVERFDWRKGCRFSTYATWWIRQAIARGPSTGARAIRLPVHVDEEIGRLWRALARLYELLGQEPSDEALADEVDMPVDKVGRLKDTAQAISSLDLPIGDDGAALQDLVEDEAAVGPDELVAKAAGREALEQVLAALPECQRQVLILPLWAGLRHPRGPWRRRGGAGHLPRAGPPTGARHPGGAAQPRDPRPPGRPRVLMELQRS